MNRPGIAAREGALRGRDDEEQPMADSDKSNGADEVKRKFREALERKNQQHARAADHLDGRSKASATHTAAAHKREFRRKSG